MQRISDISQVSNVVLDARDSDLKRASRNRSVYCGKVMAASAGKGAACRRSNG